MGMQKLIGAAGTLLTIIVIILFGNHSSGGANGVPYLPTFWRDIGPHLPPRNGYILLHQTIYFSGHGTTQARAVLLSYLAAAAILIVLDGAAPRPGYTPKPPRPRPWQFPSEPHPDPQASNSSKVSPSPQTPARGIGHRTRPHLYR
jgi:hypothetical protein